MMVELELIMLFESCMCSNPQTPNSWTLYQDKPPKGTSIPFLCSPIILWESSVVNWEEGSGEVPLSLLMSVTRRQFLLTSCPHLSPPQSPVNPQLSSQMDIKINTAQKRQDWKWSWVANYSDPTDGLMSWIVKYSSWWNPVFKRNNWEVCWTSLWWMLL